VEGTIFWTLDSQLIYIAISEEVEGGKGMTEPAEKRNDNT